MRIQQLELFTFEELSEQAQKVALNQFQDINVDSQWWEYTYQDAENIGLKITSFDIDGRNITGNFIKSVEHTTVQILTNHGENCDTYKTANKFRANILILKVKYNLQLDDEDYEGEEEDLCSDYLESLLADYLTILRNEYEYHTSEEQIKESITS